MPIRKPDDCPRCAVAAGWAPFSFRQIDVPENSIYIFPLRIDDVMNLDRIRRLFLRHLCETTQEVIRTSRMENIFALTFAGNH